METKTKIIIVSVSLALAFAAGRYSVPTKTVIETKVVEVEKKQENKDIDREKHKTTVTIERPDGSKETTVTETVGTHINTETSIDKESASSSKKTTEKAASVTVSGLAGLSDFKTPVYGASITKPFLGPIAVGFWGLTNSTFGISLGLSF